jgi:lipopolysaccharide/colanic/teichoic acid biosynthesis glycosyltransferase
LYRLHARLTKRTPGASGTTSRGQAAGQRGSRKVHAVRFVTAKGPNPAYSGWGSRWNPEPVGSEPQGRSRQRVVRAVKRALDVFLAAAALVSLSPLLLVIAILIELDSPGPIFYRAERVGFRGRPLRMLKFRKMHAGARGIALTVAGDDRLTRLGVWLARSKLDELPQLWHVLRGEMSLVGPRPESPTFVARFPAEYAVILQVRPGLTGYTQLAFVSELSILDPHDPQGHYLDSLLPQKVGLDRIYAGRVSTRRDLRILVATFATLFFRQPVAVHRATAALTLRRRATR